jgi:hypothetical protein
MKRIDNRKPIKISLETLNALKEIKEIKNEKSLDIVIWNLMFPKGLK